MRISDWSSDVCSSIRAVHVGACSAGRSLNFDVKESGILRGAKTDRRLRSEEQCTEEKKCANAGGCPAMAERPVQRLGIAGIKFALFGLFRSPQWLEKLGGHQMREQSGDDQRKPQDRKSVVKGQGVAVRVDQVGHRT